MVLAVKINTVRTLRCPEGRVQSQEMVLVAVVVEVVIYEPYRSVLHRDRSSTDPGSVELLVSAGACASVSGGCRLCVVGGVGRGAGGIYWIVDG